MTGTDQALGALLRGLLDSLWRGTPLGELDPASFETLCQAAGRHGLSGLLYVSQLNGAQPATHDLSELKFRYLVSCASNHRALRQLAEISRAFREAGVPFIVLKGCAALLTLYNHIGCREIGDIDLLIQPRSVHDARRIMADLGYSNKPLPSEVDELTYFLQGHLAPWEKAGCLAVEIHGSIFYGRGTQFGPVPEIWRHSVPVNYEGETLRCLCPAHFLIHAAVHAMKHFARDHKIPLSLKDFADALVVWKKFGARIQELDFWRIARRWGVEGDVGTVVATLNHHWNLSIPVPGETRMARVIPMSLLAQGTDSEPAPLPVAVGYFRRLSIAGAMPGLWNRARCVMRLLFPASQRAPLYYVARIFRISKRVAGDVFARSPLGKDRL